jgi:hypothetical protein
MRVILSQNILFRVLSYTEITSAYIQLLLAQFFVEILDLLLTADVHTQTRQSTNGTSVTLTRALCCNRNFQRVRRFLLRILAQHFHEYNA